MSRPRRNVVWTVALSLTIAWGCGAPATPGEGGEDDAFTPSECPNPICQMTNLWPRLTVANETGETNIGDWQVTVLEVGGMPRVLERDSCPDAEGHACDFAYRGAAHGGTVQLTVTTSDATVVTDVPVDQPAGVCGHWYARVRVRKDDSGKLVLLKSGSANWCAGL